jgi:chaperonin GroES
MPNQSRTTPTDWELQQAREVREASVVKFRFDEASDFHITPGPGRVAVQIIEASQRTQTGLWLPETSRDGDGHIGEVVAVCKPYIDDTILREPDYKVGDIIVFGKYTGSTVAVGRVQVVIMYERDVLAELEKKTDASTVPVQP